MPRSSHCHNTHSSWPRCDRVRGAGVHGLDGLVHGLRSAPRSGWRRGTSSACTRSPERWTVWGDASHGSEVVLCTDGKITLYQEGPTERCRARCRAGQYAVNPPGTWHTADVEGQATAVSRDCWVRHTAPPQVGRTIRTLFNAPSAAFRWSRLAPARHWPARCVRSSSASRSGARRALTARLGHDVSPALGSIHDAFHGPNPGSNLRCRSASRIAAKRWVGTRLRWRSRLLGPPSDGQSFELHHIGSTAIRGIWAADHRHAARDTQPRGWLDASAGRLVLAGYEAKGEFGIPGRRYFRKSSADRIRTHHLHAFAAGSPRDLAPCVPRLHERASRRGACLKQRVERELAAAHSEEMDACIAGKNGFVRSHEAQALAWAGADAGGPELSFEPQATRSAHVDCRASSSVLWPGTLPAPLGSNGSLLTPSHARRRRSAVEALVLFGLFGLFYHLYRAVNYRFLVPGRMGPPNPIAPGGTYVHLLFARRSCWRALQFVSELRSRLPALHRTLGRTYVCGATVASITAIYMGTAGYEGSCLSIAITGTLWLFFTPPFGATPSGAILASHRAFMIRSHAMALVLVWLRLMYDLQDYLFFYVGNEDLRDATRAGLVGRAAPDRRVLAVLAAPVACPEPPRGVILARAPDFSIPVHERLPRHRQPRTRASLGRAQPHPSTAARDIQPVGGKPALRLYARVGCPQDTKTSPEEFVAEVRRVRCEAVLCCLAPAPTRSRPPLPGAAEYIRHFKAEGAHLLDRGPRPERRGHQVAQPAPVSAGDHASDQPTARGPGSLRLGVGGFRHCAGAGLHQAGRVRGLAPPGPGRHHGRPAAADQNQSTPGRGRMAAYVIFDVEIRDPSQYQAFMQGVKPAIEGRRRRYRPRRGAHRVRRRLAAASHRAAGVPAGGSLRVVLPRAGLPRPQADPGRVQFRQAGLGRRAGLSSWSPAPSRRAPRRFSALCSLALAGAVAAGSAHAGERFGKDLQSISRSIPVGTPHGQLPFGPRDDLHRGHRALCPVPTEQRSDCRRPIVSTIPVRRSTSSSGSGRDHRRQRFSCGPARARDATGNWGIRSRSVASPTTWMPPSRS